MLKLNLDSVLKDKNVSLYRLEKDTKIAYSVLHRYNKNDVQRVDLSVLDKICTALNCKVDDLLVFDKSNQVATA